MAERRGIPIAVLKEFTCLDEDCGQEFESIVPVCPYCGAKANRAFRTPVGINKGSSTPGSAKKIDKMLEGEFKRQGVSNFSNCGGENKVTWARRVQQQGPGIYATQPSIAGAPRNQPPIRAFMSKPGDYSPLERDETYGFRRQAMYEQPQYTSAGHGGTPEEMMPTIDQGTPASVDMTQVARQTPLPDSLAKRTRIMREHV